MTKALHRQSNPMKPPCPLCCPNKDNRNEMGRRITFDDDGEAIHSSEDEALLQGSEESEQPVEESEQSESDDAVVEESSSAVKPSQVSREDDSSDSDEAPEEVSVSSSKAHTMELYERQKQAALSY